MALRETRIFKWWERYEHHLGVGALLVGFMFDAWMAKRPDTLSNHLLLLGYLCASAALIIVLNRREMRKLEAAHSAEPLLLLLFLQFCFGGLASNLFILYGHSGTFAGSAIFIGLLGCLVLSNEFLRNRYSQLRFNVGIYYVLLVSYLLIAVPVYLTHTIGTATFLLTVVISLGVISVFLAVLSAVVFRRKEPQKLFGVSALVVAIFMVFNVLYFLNIIPPVPLSLKDIGMYHSLLKKGDGNYTALYEQAPWWQVWRTTSEVYTLGVGESAFCFSSVFAPTNLTVPIYHRWEMYNASAKDWRTMALVAFPISGGRDAGYRGYSVKANLTPGEWRCSVETGNGSLVGRESFTVVDATTTPALSQTTL
jgi:hypothetical protein